MANAVATLAEVKQYLGLSVVQVIDDRLLSALSDAVAAFMNTVVNRTIPATNYTEAYNGNGSFGMPLNNYPILAVTALAVDTFTLNSGTQTTPGYFFNNHMVYLNNQRFTRGIQNVAVSYRAGYETIPGDWKQAHLELVGFKYHAKDHIGDVTNSTGGITTTSFVQKDMPPEVATILKQYNRVCV